MNQSASESWSINREEEDVCAVKDGPLCLKKLLQELSATAIKCAGVKATVRLDVPLVEHQSTRSLTVSQT